MQEFQREEKRREEKKKRRKEKKKGNLHSIFFSFLERKSKKQSLTSSTHKCFVVPWTYINKGATKRWCV
jgi:hypothetical protein